MALPVELIEKIAAESDLATRKNLRLVCYHMSVAVGQLLFRFMSINITPQTLINNVDESILEHLSKPTNTISQHVRTLDIKNLFVVFADRNWNGANLLYTEHHGRPSERAAVKQIRRFLSPALRSLTNLTSLRWNISVNDMEWTWADIEIALSELTKLRHLDLDFSTARWSLTPEAFPLRAFSNLHTMHLSVSTYTLRQFAQRAFRTVLRQNPHLVSLDIAHLRREGDLEEEILDEVKGLLEEFPNIRYARSIATEKTVPGR